MHVLMTGATGQLGRFIAQGLKGEGHRLTCLGRSAPFDGADALLPFDLLGPVADLPRADVLVHCALLHEPGRYRGGEGDDPERFRAANVAGTARLFEAAKSAGAGQVIFLSSRAVYGKQREGAALTEDMVPNPDTLYGLAKLEGERQLEALCGDGLKGVSLRATGIYGRPPGLASHKWSGLFADFLKGEPIPPRCGTEVHGEDLASAVSVVIGAKAQLPDHSVFNLSDLVLDRHDLLKCVREIWDIGRDLPEPLGPLATSGVMSSKKLRRLGWSPGGLSKLRRFLESERAISGH
ncbi:NAD(P)-dependent oxidoreductase [Roseibium sp. RKSG952]|uniref:NAD-dependent epimerase/dehydratase family protein n=1 Tax=Roseibium sp. RKSG952 TaxID=2529384 RepID=UPI0012BD044D|nr:NAD(P)-dependent oxidoreductase [Roseibium sp. RKSG952]MTH95615.1 NAD(P)-dependent oxidoreductase [Roseibium sp. RKSG952]